MKRQIGILLCLISIMALCSCGNPAVLSSEKDESSGFELNFEANNEKPSDTEPYSIPLPSYSPSSLPETSLPDKPNWLAVGGQEDHKKELNPVNIYEHNESITHRNFTYSNFKIVKSKELIQGVTKEQFKYFDSELLLIDENGKPTNDRIYWFISFDITNTSDRDSEIYLNSIGNFFPVGENYEYYATIIEARYRSGDSDIEAKDYFKQIIEPNTTVTYTIGYLLFEAWEDAENLYFIMDSNGTDKAYKIN